MSTGRTYAVVGATGQQGGRRAERPAPFESLGLEVLAGDDDMRRMFAWFDSPPAYRADLTAARALVPSVESFAAWLAGEETGA